MTFNSKPDMKFRLKLRIAVLTSLCPLWLPFLMTAPKIKVKSPNMSFFFLIHCKAMPQAKASIGISWFLLFLSKSYLIIPEEISLKLVPFPSEHSKIIQSMMPYFHASFLLAEKPSSTTGNSLGKNELRPFFHNSNSCRSLHLSATSEWESPNFCSPYPDSYRKV